MDRKDIVILMHLVTNGKVIVNYLFFCPTTIFFNPTTIHATGGADPHWNSLTSMCAPCLVDYDWILRLEDPSLEQDSAAFLAFSGMASR